MTWQHYDEPVYWSLPDDGATIKCSDCKRDFKCSQVILTQTPSDKRATICHDCVDEYWLSIAKNLGSYHD